MKVLVTGAAGFIGFHVSKALLARDDEVIGVDNLNSYYDVKLKEDRLAQLAGLKNFTFHKLDISDKEAMSALVDKSASIQGIVHLAAQAGVRYSLIDPYAYVQSNVMGQVVLYEMARRLKDLLHIVYASSSSVYGGNTKLPFSVNDPVDRPNSLYAATKRADELIGYTYAHLYGIPSTGLRFFTVYGPWGRPDMSPIIFARAILAREPIEVFNQGEMWRDFTYIDDIVSGVVAALDSPAQGKPPHALYNLGNDKSEKLTDFIAAMEQALGQKAQVILKPMQQGDVAATYADIKATKAALGYVPTTSIGAGLKRFAAWYRSYYGV